MIRRARARLGLGEKESAKRDLESALREIVPRMAGATANATLLTERALAHELLGDNEAARVYYKQAREAGAEDWVQDKIKALKAEKDTAVEDETATK